MDMKKWLRLQEQEATAKNRDPGTYVHDGIEYDINMSIRFGDEWFFKLVNADWDEIVPGLCMQSAVYALLTDSTINLYLNGYYTREELHQALDEAIDQGDNMKREWDKE
jgi:hypothetical protein